MATKRLLAIGSGALLATVLAGTAAQAYIATGTLYGNSLGVITTETCKAVTISSSTDDEASTNETEHMPCSFVTVKVYYTNTTGYAGWSSTVTATSRAFKAMAGNDQLIKSYHTAQR